MATAPPLVGKLVYRFEEGDATQSELLGGKGSNLCEMAAWLERIPAELSARRPSSFACTNQPSSPSCPTSPTWRSWGTTPVRWMRRT